MLGHTQTKKSAAASSDEKQQRTRLAVPILGPRSVPLFRKASRQKALLSQAGRGEIIPQAGHTYKKISSISSRSHRFRRVYHPPCLRDWRRKKREKLTATKLTTSITGSTTRTYSRDSRLPEQRVPLFYAGGFQGNKLHNTRASRTTCCKKYMICCALIAACYDRGIHCTTYFWQNTFSE